MATKSISFRYTSSGDLSSLFDNFRSMCNETIAIAIQRSPKNRFELTKIAYPQLKRYGLHSHYILSACEVAFSVYRNKRRKSVPYIRESFLKLDNLTYQLDHLLLRIPTSPRNFVFVTLVGSDYHLSLVDDSNLKRGSVTITPHSVNIAFTKEIEPFEPVGHIGLDINERNVTVSATDDWYRQFNEVCEVVEIKERYRDIRASIAQKVRGDRRIAKTLLTKYGRKEKDRTLSRLHKVSKEIVKYAKHGRLDIKMEKLKGIRKLYRKGNGQGPFYRARMNTWVFGETQRQVDYKARWEGVPDYFVNPRGTSSNCPDCGSHVVPLARRKLYCPMCDKTWDRDDLASKNIMACAVPQALPSRGSEEGEPRKLEDAGNPQSRWREGQVEGRWLPGTSQNRR